MNRREFITLLGGATAWPMAARAQQVQVRQAGILMLGAQSDADQQPAVNRIKQQLEELGLVEGRNVRIDVRWSDGRPEKVQEHAKQLVDTPCDVIVAMGPLAVAALRRETKTIPIVFWLVPDPVGQGLVASLARPGANITGFTNFEFTMASKWLGLLKEIDPPISRVSALFNPDTAPYAERFIRVLGEAAPSFGVSVNPMKAHNAAEIEAEMTAFAQGGDLSGGLLAMPDVLTGAHKDLIVNLAGRLRIPTIYAYRYFVLGGGLMSYGVNLPDHGGQTAAYVARILKGEKPADLPVQAPTKFELVINLKTAKALGLDVPPNLLATADDVIE
jgi:putative ABC transport system substrate-binding protein